MGSLLMKSWKTWLLIAAGTLTGLVAGAGLGRYVLNVPTTPVGSASPATQDTAANNASCFDNAGHKVTFVTVESGVQLEVLDWGGTGETLVLLTGLGDNAHVYDQFAYQFTDRFHVIGITRRGFGRSSEPAHGYDLDTRARDDITVLDKLNIRQAVFVGHSVAGTELNKLGAVYPDRVKKLVYLDALDIGSGGWATLPQPPPAPANTPGDLESVQRLAAASALEDGYRKPLAALCNMIRTDPSGRVLGAITPPEIYSKIHAGLQPAEYDRIKAPALGIFNKITPQFRMPYYWYLEPAQQEEFNRSIKSLSKWVEGAIQRFRSGVKNARVVELHDTNHYVFIVDEALVVREMRKFLLEE
jgi:non-heme chloroperoxidase